jgi:RNA 2',3'-cyclic 3'-phosphodiesterase
VRLFVAVNLPDSVKRAIVDAALPMQRAAPSVGWVQTDTLHITLKFLGEVAEQHTAAIEAALRSATDGLSSFPIRLGGAGGFPNLRRPRVYWLGAEGSPALLQLQTRVESALEPLGFPREARPFHAHVTLGRVGRPPGPEQLTRAERAALEIGYQTQVNVRSVELMQSRLSPKGARYEIVRSALLAEVEESP